MSLRLSPRRSLAILVACLGGLTFAAAAGAQDYKIKLQVPEKVGDTYTISATGESKRAATVGLPGGPRKQESAYNVRLEGVIKVLEVDDAGSVTRLSCTVETCLRDDKPLFDKGTVITAGPEGAQTVYSANGEKVEPPAAEALAEVLTIHNPELKNDDTTFGTAQPQKVGGTWPIDAAAAAENLVKQSKLPVKKENVEGSGKLASVKKVNDKEALQVELEVQVTGVRGELPDGNSVDGGSLEFHLSGLFPADGTRPLGLDMAMKAKFHLKTRTPDGQEVAVDVDADRHTKATFGETKEGK